MKYSKVFAVFTAVLLTLCIFNGCGVKDVPTPDAPAENKPAEDISPTEKPVEEDVFSPITVTDMTGKEIIIEEKVEKAVALTASDCEILYAIGAGDTIIGRGEYCDYPEEVIEIPAVQSGYETNIEQIITLEPQVVFLNSMDQSPEQVKALEDAGITVITSDADDIAGVYESIALIGKVMGKDEEAANVINGMKAAFEVISKDIAENGEKKTVYFEVSPLEYGLWTAGSGTFMTELTEMLGLENAFSDVEGWAEISEEQVIQRDPDYIVTITMYFGEGPTPEEEILSRTGWENMTAVKNKAVLNADSNEISRPGPRLTEAAKTLNEFFYAE